MHNRNKFVETFSDLFLKTELSKKAFADKVGIKHSQISRYLTGTSPKLSTVAKICDFFNCSIDYITGLTDDFCYKNLKKGINSKAFYDEYCKLLNLNKTTHYKLAKQGLVCETRLSSWKLGKLPEFETIFNIAYELGGSIDKMLGRI